MTDITIPRKEIPERLVRMAESFSGKSCILLRDAAAYIRELEGDLACARDNCRIVQSSCIALEKERDEARVTEDAHERLMTHNARLAEKLSTARRDLVASQEQCAALTKERDEARREAALFKQQAEDNLADAVEANNKYVDAKYFSGTSDEIIKGLKRELATLRTQLAASVPEEFEKKPGWVVETKSGKHPGPRTFLYRPDALNYANDLPDDAEVTIRPETVRTPVKMVPMEVHFNIYENGDRKAVGFVDEHTANANNAGRRFGRALKRTILVPEEK